MLIGLLAWAGTGLMPLKTAEAGGSGQADVGGAFALTDGSGRTVTDKDFRGKYMLVYFGYTHCPDVCPTTLLLIDNAVAQLGRKADRATPIFITVDPARDTPKVVGDYVKHFGPHLVGLTGSAQQVHDAAAAYKVYYSKIEDENSALGYMMDHSSFIYLMGPDGKYITHFPSTVSEESLTDELNIHIH
ncbi:MAG: SCO family protein [Alphaproteobacteria bacterium]